jgi:peroxiredoxin
MSEVVNNVQTRTVALTAAERDWIRRQGLTARVLADEQRRVRQALSVDGPEVTRVRERFRRERQLDTAGAPGSGRLH